MTKTTFASMVGVILLLTVLLGFGSVGLAVREGAIPEVGPVWFPPSTRYQVVFRIGQDMTPWDWRSNGQVAINLWVHDRLREHWHVITLLHVPLGSARGELSRSNNSP